MEKTGRSERIRTSDPVVPNDVRYQAALHSVTSGWLIDRPNRRFKPLLMNFPASAGESETPLHLPGTIWRGPGYS